MSTIKVTQKTFISLCRKRNLKPYQTGQGTLTVIRATRIIEADLNWRGHKIQCEVAWSKVDKFLSTIKHKPNHK